MIDSPPHTASAPSGRGRFLLSRLHDHTQAHHSRWDSSGRVISPTQRLLQDNTQQPLQTDIHVLGAIRTRNPNKRAAADSSPRLRGHRVRRGQKVFSFTDFLLLKDV